ncbi:hypothetical protein HPB48_014979 [Haemaphysalis longicornis]|uniref:Uncharacterized protein n=1 Tax=Haemaphysalis longicornis TaxID=44386 RepID=A0A9J6FHY6_HAELO|nr:hypothetical protein HPB48_014979 [Haemaphysalis longicornis]
MSLSGRLAAVTGGASGIGKAICFALAEEGATVVVGDINLDGAKNTAAALPGKPVAGRILNVRIGVTAEPNRAAVTEGQRLACMSCTSARADSILDNHAPGLPQKPVRCTVTEQVQCPTTVRTGTPHGASIELKKHDDDDDDAVLPFPLKRVAVTVTAWQNKTKQTKIHNYTEGNYTAVFQEEGPAYCALNATPTLSQTRLP